MITNLIRSHLLSLQPYKSARSEFSGTAQIFLDANESPFGKWNRYPDPLQNKLKAAIAEWKNCDMSQIFIGNGSDEILDLLFRLFCEPGKDKVLMFPPTYGMYGVLANINNVGTVEVPLNEEFQFDRPAIQKSIQTNQNLKLCFVCSPNNPTGNIIQQVEWLCEQFPGIVVIDEAYIQFSSFSGYQYLLENYQNIVITQTFSKALSLANIRVGFALAQPNLIEWLTKLKPPYNVSGINQQAACKQIAQQSKIEKNVCSVLSERSRISEELESISFVEKVFPSDANFLLIKVDDAERRYSQLKTRGIIIRNRHQLVENCLRITVGSKEENNKLIYEMKQL